MIDRGTVLRAFVALFMVAVIGSVAYGLFSSTDGTSGNFPDDDRVAYGPIFEEPDGYQKALLADPWVNRIPVPGGTFGSAISKQVRIKIDGTGDIPGREVTLQTPPAVAMFAGPQRERAERMLHGIEELLEDRGGLLQGLSLTESRGGYQAAAIAGIVETRVTDGYASRGDQRVIERILRQQGVELVDHVYAWYDDGYQQVIIGPEISRRLLQHVRAPGTAKPAENLFAAYVVLHELEHAITPADDRGYEQLQWMEEGSADVLARWPGAAAGMAKRLGMPYPERYDEVQYATSRGGYPAWTTTMRVLLAGAGVDVTDPAASEDAARLLQATDVTGTPERIAARIARRNRLTPQERIALEAGIRKLDGSTSRAKRLLAQYR